MSGRARLPSGAPRKASQKRARPAIAVPQVIVALPTWRAGDKVRWQHHTGTYLHDAVEEGLADVRIGERTYRVKKAELKAA